MQSDQGGANKEYWRQFVGMYGEASIANQLSEQADTIKALSAESSIRDSLIKKLHDDLIVLEGIGLDYMTRTLEHYTPEELDALANATASTGRNEEGIADLEMRFEVLQKDYKTLHGVLTRLSKTHANPTIHDALREVNPCWIPADSRRSKPGGIDDHVLPDVEIEHRKTSDIEWDDDTAESGRTDEHAVKSHRSFREGYVRSLEAIQMNHPDMMCTHYDQDGKPRKISIGEKINVLHAEIAAARRREET